MAIFDGQSNRKGIACAAWILELAFIAAICALFAPAAHSARQPGPLRRAPQATTQSPHVFENGEIRVLIPPGWAVSTAGDAASQPLSRLGPHLQLSKNSYTLSLAYAATTKGDPQTRFTQIFAMPWLTPNQTLGCSYYLRPKQQIVNSSLLFINLSMSAADLGIDKACGMSVSGGSRWFGGFFTNAARTYFIPSKGAGCGEKAYILTSAAQSPGQLPASDDLSLTSVVGEAGRIVASIQYKRCPLATAPSSGMIGGPPPVQR